MHPLLELQHCPSLPRQKRLAHLHQMYPRGRTRLRVCHFFPPIQEEVHLSFPTWPLPGGAPRVSRRQSLCGYPWLLSGLGSDGPHTGPQSLSLFLGAGGWEGGHWASVSTPGLEGHSGSPGPGLIGQIRRASVWRPEIFSNKKVVLEATWEKCAVNLEEDKIWSQAFSSVLPCWHPKQAFQPLAFSLLT